MRYIVFIIVIAVTAYGFFAYDQQKAEKHKPNIVEIMPPLLIGFYDFPVKRQDYIDGHLAFIKFNGRTQTSIDTFDAILRSEKMYADAITRAYKQMESQAERLLKIDLNNDKVITKEELSQDFPYPCQNVCFSAAPVPSGSCPQFEETKECTRNKIDEFLNEHDKNSDQKIDSKEIKTMISGAYYKNPTPPKNLSRRQEEIKIKIRIYLQLASNQDGHLNIEELTKIAGDFFDRYDTNQDGVISKEEGKAAFKIEKAPPATVFKTYSIDRQCGYTENGQKKCLKGHLAYRKLTPDKTPLP